MGVLAGTPRATVGRALTLGVAAGACGLVAAALTSRVAALAPDVATARTDDLVELGVLAGGVLVLAWLAASAALAASCLAVRGAGRTWRRGEACVHRFAPALVRRALVVVVAAGLGVGTVTAASAADLPPTVPTATAAMAVEGAALDLGWVVTGTGSDREPATPTPAATGTTTAAPAPAATATAGPAGTDTPAAAPGATDAMTAAPAATGRTTARPAATDGLTTATGTTTPSPTVGQRPAPRAGTTEQTTPSVDATVTVVPGDSLWAIAARHLPAGSTDAEVADAWPAWYAANAATIGADPDLILPGQHLHVPGQVAP